MSAEQHTLFDTHTALARFELDRPHSGAYIAGTGWAPTEGRERIEVIFPATGEVVAEVASATLDDYEAIVQHAVEAQKRWRLVPPPSRGEFVRRIGQAVEEQIDALAALVSLDTGKSIMESKGELKETIDMAMLASGQSRMMYGYTQQSQRAEHRMYDQWLPLGVVGVISAYNFPAAVWAQNGFLAAVAGNTVIWKPSPKVPLTAIALQRLVNDIAVEMGHEGVFSLFIPAENSVASRMSRTLVST